MMWKKCVWVFVCVCVLLNNHIYAYGKMSMKLVSGPSHCSREVWNQTRTSCLNSPLKTTFRSQCFPRLVEPIGNVTFYFSNQSATVWRVWGFPSKKFRASTHLLPAERNPTLTSWSLAWKTLQLWVGHSARQTNRNKMKDLVGMWVTADSNNIVIITVLCI